MALIKCAECHKEITDKANNCPYCGFPKSKKKHSPKVKYIIGGSLLVIFGVVGFLCYNYEHNRSKQAQQQLNELVEDVSYPSRPNSYDELLSILQSYPISSENRRELTIKCYSYQNRGMNFEDTPLYYDWNRYRTYFTKIGEKP